MEQKRKLAAIMFTDIVGFTAIMSLDEMKALKVLQKNRDVLKPLIRQHNGEWLKEIGDGTLSSFDSAVDAVNCALEIQRSLKDDSELRIRIGMHVGDVVVYEGDVFGDGVNIASRIEPLAEAGGICISERVYDDVRNKTGIETVFLGEKMLKNVNRPMKVYALTGRGLPIPPLERKTHKEVESAVSKERTAEEKQKPSIAVLPFTNMNADPEQEYFCDGMTEEVINALTHIENLKVIARTSAFMFKGKHEDMREIGRKLDVEHLLEGSIRKSGNRLRITAQLIKVSDGSHLWSEHYDREMEDVFDIQDEISLAIVDNLKVKLLGKEKAAIVKRYTEDLEAYNLYLKGNYYWQMLTREGFDKGIECYEQALKKDPHYALVYAGMASACWSSSHFGGVPPNEAYPKAEIYAAKALEIDNTLAEAHVSMGLINMNYNWKWKAAEREFNQALQLNPNSALIRLLYSILLLFTDRHNEAAFEAKRAQELDPLSSYINTWVALAFNWDRQYDRAIEELQKTIAMHPNHSYSHYLLGITYLFKSMFREAITEGEKAVELSGGNPFVMGVLACTYYLSGEIAKAEKLFDSVKQMSRDQYVAPMIFYQMYKIWGDQDQAYVWLERACNEHDSFLPYYIFHPFDKYRIPDEPRFKALMKKAGLEE